MHEGEQGGVRCVRGSRGGARVAQGGAEAWRDARMTS